MQKRQPGNAHEKRNCWSRGNGAYSFRGELKHGIRLNKKRLNRKVRRASRLPKGRAGFKKVERTILSVDFS